APADRPAQLERAVLEPEAVVLADRLAPAAEVDALRPRRRRKQLRQRGRELAPLVERAQQVRVGGGMQLPQERQDLAADQAAEGVRVGRVGAEGEALRAAVGLRLRAPELEQRTDDPVLAPDADPARAAARDEPVEDRLDLVG